MQGRGMLVLLIAIVDDTKQDIEALHGKVKAYLDGINERYVIHVFQDSVEFIRSQEEYNIVFLDIHMDKLNGLEVAHLMRKISTDVILIFVTQMAQMAIKGYEVEAMDFIIKPADKASIDRVMQKAISRIANQSGVSLILKTSKEVISLSSNKIQYIEVYDHNLIYHTTQGELRVRGTLGEVRKKLDEKHFVMCNRSYLVNLRYISSIHDNYLKVGDEVIPVSKSHRKEIEKRFVVYLGENV